MSPTPATADITSWRISYLITTEDPAMPIAFQRGLIEDAKKAGITVEQVKEIRSGHFVQITHSKETADWIKEVGMLL